LVDKGHGRLEIRTQESTTVLNVCLDWPGVSQVFRLTRVRKTKGVETTEDVYGITSLSRQKANAEALIGYVRSHWGIENRLHHVRDVTFGEDDCRVRSGSAPQILAANRNLTVPLLRAIQPKNIAAAMRRLAAKPRQTIKLMDYFEDVNGPQINATFGRIRFSVASYLHKNYAARIAIVHSCECFPLNQLTPLKTDKIATLFGFRKSRKLITSDIFLGLTELV
jgi:predicted transposase YbfD/YdcC